MDTRGKLKRVARQRGYDSVEDMVSAGLEKYPTMGGAAKFCTVAPNAIKHFLETEGLVIVTEVKARLVRADSGFPVNEGE